MENEMVVWHHHLNGHEFEQALGVGNGHSLSITNSWSLLKLMSVELVTPTNHLILCHPLPLPPSTFPDAS